jgi:membrane-associated protease RseP (regulator of RpoE activity)
VSLNGIKALNDTFATTDTAQQLATAISRVFALEQFTTGPGDGRVIRLQGQLLTDSQQAYAFMAEQLEEYGYTPLLRPGSGHVTVVAVPRLLNNAPKQDRGAFLLFVLTIVSMLFAGALAEAPDLRWVLRHPLAGFPFAATLLSILAAHELGHYFTARRLGVSVSLPYFIPMPLSPFGTMGAVIRTRGPTRNRRQILAIGAAGPLAGLAVAIPLLIYGLLNSNVEPIPIQPGVWMEGNSLFYSMVKFLIFGQVLPRDGYDVFLHPVAFAAWAGLLVTALNLIPAGQLDGGHIAYALLGRGTRWLNRLAVVLAAILSVLWSGWLFWALILSLLGQRNAEPLDDVTRLTAKQKAFALCMLAVFVLLFTPKPMTLL